MRVSGGGGVELQAFVAEPVCGPARATVVLTHGFSMSSAVWAHQMRPGRLGDDVRVVSWDLRGHGASARPSEPAAYRDPHLWADDLDAVVRGTCDGSPVVLVAWSYGARVVGDYLAHHGEGMLAGVVLVGTRVRDDRDHRQTTHGSGLSAKAAMLSPGSDASDAAARFVELCFTTPPTATLLAGVMGDVLAVPWWVRRAMDGRPLTVHEAAVRCGVPVLVVHGGRDQMFPLGAARVAGEVFGADVLVYEQCGHALFMEEPDRFCADVARFTRGCAQRPS